MKKSVLFFLSSILVILLCGCGAEEIVPEQNDSVVVETNEVVESSEIVEEVDPFVPDYVPGEKNTVGNSSANLMMEGAGYGRNCGQVTGQGEWAYYYIDGEIKKINNDGEIHLICSVTKAHSLNVIGDWLYFASGNSIYKIRTDGTLKEEIIRDADDNGAFHIVENIIYYVKKTQVSSSGYTYSVCKYNVDSAEYECPELECDDVYLKLLGVVDDELFYIYEYDSEQIVGGIDTVTMRLSGKEMVVAGRRHNGVNESFIHEGQLLIIDYIEPTVYWMSSTMLLKGFDLNQFEVNSDMTGISIFEYPTQNIRLKNIYGSSLIAAVEGTSIYRVQADAIYNSITDDIPVGCVIEESERIGEVYIVGNFIYYRLVFGGSSMDVDRLPLYRVNVDGTNWCQL